MYCHKCGVVIKNLSRHYSRNRCEAQHFRKKDGGFCPTGINGTGGKGGLRDNPVTWKAKR